MIELFSPLAYIEPSHDGWAAIALTGSEAASASMMSSRGDGPRVNHLQAAPDQLTYDGEEIEQFSRDFYDRLHISQATLELGNVIGLQSREVTIWNAYRRVQVMAALAEVDTEGIDITGQPAPPLSFAVFQERAYTISVSTEGPPTIDATVTFDFSPYDLVLHITGSRITAWSFIPDWSNPLVERLEWLTDVLQSFDASEQRRALRLAPRKTYEFESFFIGKERRYAEALMWGWGARVWALPIWPDGLDLQDQYASGATEILLDTVSRDYEAGGLAILLSDAFVFEVIEIETVSADRISLQRPLSRTWAAGSRIYPARTARLQAQVRIPRWDGQASGVRVAFDLSEPVDHAANAGAATHRGYPVLTSRPEWSGGLDVELRRKLAQLDSMTGGRVFDDESGLPNAMQSMRFTWVSRAEQEAYRQLLYALRGRHGAVWVPTWTQDLVPVAVIASTAQAIDVEFTAYTLQISMQPGRADIRIELTDGTVYYREITAAQQLDADTERLQIGASLGRTVQPSEIAVVSFMALSRLSGDAVELAHWTGDVCDSAVSFQSFRHDV